MSATHSTRVTLNTRHGTRPNRTSFDTCKWFLPDPVIAPSNDYTLYADVTFVSIPSDHKRINFQRGTNLLLVEKRSKVSGRVYELAGIVILAGDYTREGLAEAFTKALINKDVYDQEDENGVEIKNEAEYLINGSTVKIELAHVMDQNNDYNHGFQVDNIVLTTTNPKYAYRIVVDGVHNGAEALGIHDTTGWCDSDTQYQIANSVVDVHGTRTVTINALGLAGNHTDIVDRYRRRCVLRTIPIPGSQDHKLCIWERPAGKDGHPISSKCLTSIELSLWDDMGFPFDPRHHWTVCLEIYALKNEYFSYTM